MADNDSIRGRGRGTGRGISRGRGRGRGRGTSTLSPPPTEQPTHPTGQSTRPSSSQTPIAPQLDRSTPSPYVSSTESPHIPATHSPSHNLADAASGDGPHAASTSHVGSSPQSGSRDTDGRIWIRPGPQNTFEPPIQPTREITKIIKGKFEGCWESYREVKTKDEKVAEMWYKEFQRKYKWLPEHETQIKRSFDHKASEGYSNAMYRVRRKIDQGSWIPNEMRERLEQKWNEDNWKGKAKVNTDNRRSSDGSLHTGGSIPTTEHFKRLKKSPDMIPSCWELFQRTHKVKGDTLKWVSSKAETIAHEYERRILERDSQETPGDDVSSHESDNNVYLEVVGGINKKGRIFGLGSEAGKYKPTSSPTSYDGLSSSEYEQMRTLVSSLSAENKTLKEQLLTHEELIRASQEESRKSREESRLVREQLLRFMESFSLGHPSPLAPPHSDPPLPPTTDQDNEPDDNGLDIDDEDDLDVDL